MEGRITSKDKSVNRHGVPLAEVLRLEREANQRYEAKLRALLTDWLEIAKAVRRGEPPAQVTKRIGVIEEATKLVLK